jgi:hypothetical protein
MFQSLLVELRWCRFHDEVFGALNRFISSSSAYHFLCCVRAAMDFVPHLGGAQSF